MKLTIPTWIANAFSPLNLGLLLAALVVILPVAVVIWAIGLPGKEIPSFVNLGIRVLCQEPIEPSVHIHIPVTEHKDRALRSSASDMRVAIQIFPALLQKDGPTCSAVSIFSDNPLLHPAVVKFLPPSAGTWEVWFYTDVGSSYEESFLVSNNEDSNVTLDDSHLVDFAGAVTFELNNVIQQTGIDTRSFSFSIYVDGTTTKIKTPMVVGASIAIPSNLRLLQALSVPTPANVLATNRGSRYEFLLHESLLGNTTNSAHWASLHAVMEDTLWAKWREYTLFVMSGLFGFGIGFLLEALLSRMNRR